MITHSQLRSRLNYGRRFRSRGYAITEFASAFALLIIGLLLPLLDLGFIPIRYGLACSVLSDLVGRLALSNKVSDACMLIEADSSWQSALSRCGVQVRQTELAITVIGRDGELRRFAPAQAGCISADLLPNGKNGPGVYALQLNVDVDIAPLLSVRGPGVPGLTSPVSMNILTHALWENLGRDPDTTRYFLDE